MNQVLKTFRHGMVLSFTDLNYYVDVLNSSVKFSIKFVALFYLILGVCSGVYFGFVKLPQYDEVIDQTAQEIHEYYPQDWKFQWNGKTLSSDSEQIKTIQFPNSFTHSDQLPKNLAIVDTSSDDAPDNTPALMYINSGTVYVNSLSGFWSDLPLSEILGEQNFEITREIVLRELPDYVSQAKASLKTLPFFVFVAMSFGLFLARIFTIAIDVIIIHFVMSLMKKPIPYKKVFQLALHVLIPVEILQQLSNLLYPELDFPMFTVAFWALIALILFHFRNLHMVMLVKDKKGANEK